MARINKKLGEKSPVKELVLKRIFDAPRELVFKAWTDPKQVAKWWGPHLYTNPICEWDARVGGEILVHMKGPTGTHPMSGVFKEIKPPVKLVFTAGVPDGKGKMVLENLNTVTFGVKGKKTQMTLKVKVLQAMEEALPMLEGMKVGWSQSLEKLAELLGEI